MPLQPVRFHQWFSDRLRVDKAWSVNADEWQPLAARGAVPLSPSWKKTKDHKGKSDVIENHFTPDMKSFNLSLVSGNLILF